MARETDIATPVTALTENSGAIGGSNDGNLPDLTATAGAIVDSTGGTPDTSDPVALEVVTAPTLSDWDGATVFPSAAQATAINAAFAALTNNQATQSNAYDLVLADNVALRAAVRELAAKVNQLQATVNRGD